MPIWLLLILVVVIAGGYVAFKNYQDKKELEEYTKEFNLTLDELKEYNGVKNKRIFICVKDDIFDVSSSTFYTPGGSYHIFAGHDATASLAKADLEGKYLNTQAPLNEEERQTLEDWHNRFTEKYRRVGKLNRK